MMSMDKGGLKAGNPVAVVILAPDHLKLLRLMPTRAFKSFFLYCATEAHVSIRATTVSMWG